MFVQTVCLSFAYLLPHIYSLLHLLYFFHLLCLSNRLPFRKDHLKVSLSGSKWFLGLSFILWLAPRFKNLLPDFKRLHLLSMFFNSTWYIQYKFHILFAIGNAETDEEQEMINQEIQIHGDILQVDLVDTYRNITLKVFFPQISVRQFSILKKNRWVTQLQFCSIKAVNYAQCKIFTHTNQLCLKATSQSTCGL